MRITSVSNKKPRKIRSGPKFCNLCGKDVYGLAAHRKNEHKGDFFQKKI